jgi:hypothetical protein
VSLALPVLGHRQQACCEHTRLQRLLRATLNWSDQIVTAPSFFTVINRYSIYLLFPIRQGRSPGQVGKMSKDTEMREDT